MLKITPYIPIIIPIVIVGGLINPLFGYILALDMLVLIMVSPFKGRFFCGNLCSRGLFNDFILQKISRKVRIPKIFYNMIFRLVVLAIMMGFMIYRLIGTQGVLMRVGAVLVSMYIMQTIIISVIAIFVSPRAWCQFCPAGTLQRLFNRGKNELKADKADCIGCGICNKVCPMGIPVKEIINHPDCIKCGRCVDACPKDVLYF